MNATEILLPEGMTGEEAIGQLAPLVAEYDAKAAAALQAGAGSADAKTEAASFQRAADIYRHALDLVCEKTPDPRCPPQGG